MKKEYALMARLCPVLEAAMEHAHCRKAMLVVERTIMHMASSAVDC